MESLLYCVPSKSALLTSPARHLRYAIARGLCVWNVVSGDSALFLLQQISPGSYIVYYKGIRGCFLKTAFFNKIVLWT